MDQTAARIERRQIKQKLFQIRRFIEGELDSLPEDLKELKETYESLNGFSGWNDFPDKWDIGDPHSVKKDSFLYSEIDKSNAERRFGKSYETIVRMDVPPKQKVSRTDQEKV